MGTPKKEKNKESVIDLLHGLPQACTNHTMLPLHIRDKVWIASTIDAEERSGHFSKKQEIEIQTTRKRFITIQT